MADREKVLRGLECCKSKTCDYARPDVICPYIEWSGEYETSCYECTIRLANDAFYLLKEQEPVQAIRRETVNMWYWCCGSCGVPITEGDKFCRMCGRRVKWDADK